MAGIPIPLLAAGIALGIVSALVVASIFIRTCEIIYNFCVDAVEFCVDAYKFLLQKNK